MARSPRSAAQTSSVAQADEIGAGWTSPPLRIVSAQEGRWRAGMPHTRQAQLHPAGTFTLEQVEALELDPVLSVERLTDEQYTAAKAAQA